MFNNLPLSLLMSMVLAFGNGPLTSAHAAARDGVPQPLPRACPTYDEIEKLAIEKISHHLESAEWKDQSGQALEKHLTELNNSLQRVKPAANAQALMSISEITHQYLEFIKRETETESKNDLLFEGLSKRCLENYSVEELPKIAQIVETLKTVLLEDKAGDIADLFNRAGEETAKSISFQNSILDQSVIDALSVEISSIMKKPDGFFTALRRKKSTFNRIIPILKGKFAGKPVYFHSRKKEPQQWSAIVLCDPSFPDFTCGFLLLNEGEPSPRMYFSVPQANEDDIGISQLLILSPFLEVDFISKEAGFQELSVENLQPVKFNLIQMEENGGSSEMSTLDRNDDSVLAYQAWVDSFFVALQKARK